jgi:hypothetical protein
LRNEVGSIGRRSPRVGRKPATRLGGTLFDYSYRILCSRDGNHDRRLQIRGFGSAERPPGRNQQWKD